MKMHWSCPYCPLSFLKLADSIGHQAFGHPESDVATEVR